VSARDVQIDLQRRMSSVRDRKEVKRLRDRAQTLRALLSPRDRKSERSWRECGRRDDSRSGAHRRTA
jgi:hypothetical protein